jgi:hypothetical protein
LSLVFELRNQIHPRPFVTDRRQAQLPRRWTSQAVATSVNALRDFQGAQGAAMNRLCKGADAGVAYRAGGPDHANGALPRQP